MNTSDYTSGGVSAARYRRYLAALTLFHQAAADASGLSGTDYQASNLLDLEGPMTNSELARRLGVSLAAGSRLVDRLIAAGVARRSVDDADRRRVLIAHTGVLPAGLDDALARVRQPIAEALDGMSPEQLAGVAGYLAAAEEAYTNAAREVREMP